MERPMKELTRQDLHTLLRSAGIPEADVTTGYTDAYSYGPANLAVHFPDEKTLSRFFQIAQNHLTTRKAGDYFRRTRDAGAPKKPPGRHEGGTVGFPTTPFTYQLPRPPHP